MCVGLKFAEAELKAILTHLLQRYTVHLKHDMGAMDATAVEPETLYESGVLVPKDKLRFEFRRREAAQ